MAKFPLYIALCVALIYYSFAAASNPQLETLGEGEFAIYSRQDVSSPLVTRRISSGIGFIYFTHSSNAAALRAKFDYIDGESIVIPHMSGQEVLRRLGHREVSYSNGIWYGYSPRARSFIRANGQRINLQVVERQGTTVVGWPVILGVF